MGLTQIYTLGDDLGFELNDGSTVSFKYGEHKEGLLGLLIKLGDELGRVPTFEDVFHYPKTPHPNTYAFYFGSFDRAIEQVAGRWRIGKWEKKPNEQDLEEAKGEDEMKRKKWTKGEIITLVIRKETELGHFPTLKDFQNDPELPSYQTISNKFGGLLDLRGEVQAKKERDEQIMQREQQGQRSPEEEAIEAILATVTTEPAKVEETEPEGLASDALEATGGVVVKPIGPEELALIKEDDEEGAIEEVVVREAEPEIVEEEPVEDEPVEEIDVEEPVEVKSDEQQPVQTSVEIKDSETGKTMKIVITLEIFFPK